MTSKEFLQRIDDVIARNAMLSHSFYKMWNEGKLDTQILGEYAKQYYAHVSAFPTYVSAVHSHCTDISTRQMLLENLIEEEQGEENHPELWMRFAEGMGASREAVHSAELLDKTKESVATMKSITQSEDPMCGIAALYAYESQIPAVSESKRTGLNAFYGVKDERTVQFFRVHEKADLIHRQVEREILATCTDEAQQQRVLAAAEQSSKALWHFLDGVQEAYIGEMQCA
jgi:pyrroloquinoline-quinone synthase